MLNQDYREMLSTLLENEVSFLLMGAYAMAVHGFPRATADMGNAQKVYNAFGAAIHDIKPMDFEKKGTIFQIGVAPRRIDIINDIDGVEFDEAAEDKVIIELEGLSVPVISRQKLIINKRSTGRDQDRIDAEKLSGIKGL